MSETPKINNKQLRPQAHIAVRQLGYKGLSEFEREVWQLAIRAAKTGEPQLITKKKPAN